MLKNNKWILIGISVAAVVAYDFFVLKPYNLKYQQYLQGQKTSEQVQATGTPSQSTPNQGAASTVQTNSTAVPPVSTISLNVEAQPWILPDTVAISKLDFSGRRSALAFGDGRIGRAQFNDYTVRGTKEKTPIVISEYGYRWTSTDTDVQKCLQSFSLSNTSTSQGGFFSATTEKGTCAVKYDLDSKIDGHIYATLELTGFTTSKGDLSFSTLGVPTTGLSQDHHFLSTSINESVSHIKDKKLFEETKLEGQVSWIMWGDRYFSSTLLPRGKWNPTVFHRQKDLVEKNDTKLVEYGFRYPLLIENNKGLYESELYFSTRDGDILDLVKPGLSKAVELGFFGAIANLLLLGLRGLNVVFNNFGWSIVVLTLLVRLLFWPLNKKVFASSKRMKDIQPEVEKIKAKYGTDKSKAQEMQAEIWAMYKKNNVNPVGSCLPLLLQMPIFFALYGALNHSIDLYQAPFFGWVTDLSSPDPFYVFPVLWTLSLLAYLKINPQQPTQPGAPDMKWIMIGMNIFIGYLSKDWPSGLTLYLFVSNLVGILQQIVMLRGGKKLQTVQEGV